MGAKATAARLPRPGDVIADKYAVVRVIGEGGMGVVFEAVHQKLRQRVAIKVLMPDVLKDQDVVARFEREARAASQLHGPHVARVIDVDETDGGLPYMVMEYLEGHDLEAELQAGGAMPIADAVGYVLQVCNAMEEAHAAGIVHRDLKPSNLFLCPERGVNVVKVLDFGISKMSDEGDARLTATHATVGTPLYMSPEQVRSSRNVDARTDIWSLGVILYELLAGRPPFMGSMTGAAAAIVADPAPPLREFRGDVPDALEAVVERALAKDPNRRYPTVSQFAAALAPFGQIPTGLPTWSDVSSSGPRPALAERIAVEQAPTLASQPVHAPPSAREHRDPALATASSWATASKSVRPKRAVVVIATLALAGMILAAAVLHWQGTKTAVVATSTSTSISTPTSMSTSISALAPPASDSAGAEATPPATGSPAVANGASSSAVRPARPHPPRKPSEPSTTTAPSQPAAAPTPTNPAFL